jgi:predicted AlkP superfamily pyrophosphatase or phosphodiesterase
MLRNPWRLAFVLVLVALTATCRTAGVNSADAPAPRVLVLASIDGFRADYLDRGVTPNLAALAQRGVRARRMIPSFPSKTFPNHYSIATGLYPGHHGIVANHVWDSVLGAFSMDNRRAVQDGRWWGGEPIWITAERAGLRTAPLFWPGSEAMIHGTRPSEWRPWDDGETDMNARLAWVEKHLSRPVDRRPRFVSFYTEVVDNAGHEFGPSAPEVDRALAIADRAIGRLVGIVRRHHLEDVVDLVVVSDHGMTEVSIDRRIFLDDLVPDWKQVLEVVDWNPLFAANLKQPAEADRVLASLQRTQHLQAHQKADTPESWHYRNSPRVPAVLALADEGWTITTHDRKEDPWVVGGNHGYDPTLPAMGAIFIAAGPSFRQGVVLEPFENVNLYSLFCRILDLAPAPNDGELEPLKPALR